MEYLSGRYRGHAIDLCGFGDSDKLRGLYIIGSYVELLREFLDEMGIWSTPLVGRGLGGIVALVFAAMVLALVERVVTASVPVVGIAIARARSLSFLATAVRPRGWGGPRQEACRQTGDKLKVGHSSGYEKALQRVDEALARSY